MNNSTKIQIRRRKLQELEANNDDLQSRVDVLLRRTSHSPRASTSISPGVSTRKHSMPEKRTTKSKRQPSVLSSRSAENSAGAVNSDRRLSVTELVGKFDQTAAEFRGL